MAGPNWESLATFAPAENAASVVGRGWDSLASFESKPAVPPKGALGKALEPITSYPATEAQMARESAGQVATGVGQIASGIRSAVNPNAAAPAEPDNRPDWLKNAAPTNDQGLTDILKGAGNAAVGAAGYVTAPINAALRTVIGKPVEENTGIPKEYTEFATSLALPMPKRIPFPAPKVAAPTIGELRAAASAGYEAPEVAAVQIKPESVAEAADRIRAELAAKYKPRNAPSAFAAIDDIKQGTTPATPTFQMQGLDSAGYTKPEPPKPVTVDDLDAARRDLAEVINKNRATIASPGDRTERAVAREAMRKLDAYIDTVPQSDLVAGNAAEASQTIQQARENHSAAESAALLDTKQMRAELRTAATHSGQNLTNAMRQRVADILVNPAERRGYSQAELAMMKSIVEGTGPENFVRGAGKVLGGGGGMHSFIAGVPTMGVAPAVGFALTKLSNGMTRANVAKLNEMVRMDSPLGRQISAPLEDWARAAQAAEQDPTGRSLAMLTITSRNLANNLKDAGVAVSPDDILRTIREGTVPAGAEDKQQ